MKTLQTMTKDERSLLLFFESCAVDQNGKINTRHMNELDIEIAKKWHKEGFCQYGRIASENVNEFGSHWCKLSDEAWKLAHEERKARGLRAWNARTWKTTEEIRNKS